MGAKPTACVSQRLPHSVIRYKYGSAVNDEAPDIKNLLWQNIQRLMLRDWGAVKKGELARRASLSGASLTRIAEAKTSVGVDVLQLIAEVFNVQTWQLLAPEAGANLHIVHNGTIAAVIPPLPPLPPPAPYRAEPPTPLEPVDRKTLLEAAARKLDGLSHDDLVKAIRQIGKKTPNATTAPSKSPRSTPAAKGSANR